MSKGEVRVGDNNTTHEITIKDQEDAVVDLSAASSMTVLYLKPGSAGTFTKTGTYVTDGTDGKLKTTFLSADLDVKGSYKWQVTLVFPQGTWRTDLHTLEVHANLA
jgi:hypothetical protein